MNRWISPFLVIAASAIPPAAFSQDDPEEPTVLTIRPAGEPTPALKYTLLPERRDLVPGNAAIFYHRAFHILLESRGLFPVERPSQREEAPWGEDVLTEWIQGPLDQIPRDKARAQLDFFRSPLHEIELGTRRHECNWEYDSRSETIDLPIPELNFARSFARLITLRVRVAILEGDIEGAIHWLQAGYALARHVGEGPTLIQWLVGVAITGFMNDALTELIQAEGTPSLYWALANLPRPIVDMSRGLEGERSLVERMFPDVLELDGPAWSVERGRVFLDSLAAQLEGLSSGSLSESESMRLGLIGLIARNYPDAKRELIASGRSEAEVEAMPAIQVFGIVAMRDYVALSDDVYKWVGLPYWEAYREIEARYAERTIEEKLARPGLTLFLISAPGLNNIRIAQVRADRQIAAIQCVEAIRLYAHTHDGRFPPSLEAIEEAPAPLDPATGEPFGYAVEGDEASLLAPLVPGGWDDPAYRINYRLRLAD